MLIEDILMWIVIAGMVVSLLAMTALQNSRGDYIERDWRVG